MFLPVPWQSTTANPRTMTGVLRHADFNPVTGVLGAFGTLQTGASGDARGSTANSLVAEFLGDYNYAWATNDIVAAVWNDAGNAADCPAIDAWRQANVDFLLGTGSDPGPAPAPQQSCPVHFGNADIYSVVVTDPT